MSLENVKLSIVLACAKHAACLVFQSCVSSEENFDFCKYIYLDRICGVFCFRVLFQGSLRSETSPTSWVSA